MPSIAQKTQAQIPKLRFSTWWPWPLTYVLAHRTHLRGQSLCQILWSYVNPFSRESIHTQRDTHTERYTHTPTDGSVFITSTADAGGNNIFNGRFCAIIGHVGRVIVPSCTVHFWASASGVLGSWLPSKFSPDFIFDVSLLCQEFLGCSLIILLCYLLLDFFLCSLN